MQTCGTSSHTLSDGAAVNRCQLCLLHPSEKVCSSAEFFFCDSRSRLAAHRRSLKAAQKNRQKIVVLKIKRHLTFFLMSFFLSRFIFFFQNSECSALTNWNPRLLCFYDFLGFYRSFVFSRGASVTSSGLLVYLQYFQTALWQQGLATWCTNT